MGGGGTGKVPRRKVRATFSITAGISSEYQDPPGSVCGSSHCGAIQPLWAVDQSLIDQFMA